MMVALKTFAKTTYCLLICCGLLLPTGHTQEVQLEVLNNANGLSQGMIYDILQDRKGFLWFATRGGLNRYDGYTFKALKNDPFNPYSIADNTVQTLLEDRRGWIWLGTENNGIDIYEPNSGKFFHLNVGENGLSHGNVTALTEAPDGAIWVGTKNGLNCVKINKLPTRSADLSTEAKVERYFWEQPSASVSPANLYESVLCTKGGILWVGSQRNAYRYDLKTRKKEVLPTAELNVSITTQANYFTQDPQGNVWLGQSSRVIRFRKDKMDIFPFPKSDLPYTTYLAFDHRGNLYVGRRKYIYFFAQDDLAKNRSLAPKVFFKFPMTGVMGSTKIHCDRNGLLWIGTNGYGIRRYNLVNQYFQHFLPGISARRLCADRFGQLWAWENTSTIKLVDEESKVTTRPFIEGGEFFNHDLLQAQDSSYWFLGEWRAGPSGAGVLIQKGAKTGSIQRYPSPIEVGIFSQILEDHLGNIWIFGRNSEMARFDVKNKKLTTFSYASLTGIKEASYAKLEDQNKHFWIGSPHGLVHGVLGETGQMQFRLHQCDPRKASSLSSNVILSLCDDPENPKEILWVGTRGGGLNLFNKKTGECEHFNINNGLPDDVIYGILPDARGNLWLSTNSGLSKFTPKSGHFENYSAADGLQDNEFNTVSHAKGYDGRLFFGGVNGITAFYPKKIAPNINPPEVFITALKINNKTTLPGAGILTQNIETTKSITIPFAQNHITLDFVAMDFAAATKNQFRYRLEGVDKKDVESTTVHSVNYSNLPPGKHTFKLSSGGAHGVWPEELKPMLTIRVLPPWWRSPFAYTLYVLLIFLGVYQFIQWRVRRDKAKNQREFEKRELERIQALEQIKADFFTNITHELRTPITLIVEPLRQLLNQPQAENWLAKVQIAERSSSKLLHLVNQLLDLAKLEGRAMKLENSWGSVDDVLVKIATAFEAAAVRKNITLSVNPIGNKVGESYFDSDKFEKIISNLLSNALKFTPERGNVQLQWYAEQAEVGKKTLFVEIKDTGPGIAAEHQAHIFERFYTLDRTVSDAQASTGVGLSLSKELAEMMGGQIEVESTVGMGALFRLRLPLQISPLGHKMLPNQLNTVDTQKSNQQATSHEGTLVLVVEDNDDLRDFLVQTLLEKYEVISAINGKVAFEMACERIPDVIISDLVMPEVDGLELLQLLKNEITTSHIPLVLLTAKSSLESRIKGLQYGAEAYLPKPFNTEELKAWIDTLLENRRQLQLRLNKNHRDMVIGEQAITPAPETPVRLSAIDEEFLQRLEQVISQELENENLNVEDLARLLFISRSQLHRKVIALTGLSSTEFIRKFRLEHAMHLLQTERGKVSDIAQRVGFRNVKYFSTAFKEHFGKSPSEI
ncbi:two-component regulator propeller domain-containing protein [Haliscomenobacter sp.]|uniref:hybrid sensor histidine kinase/response regulator transcription factor n=1 Tax=Haliscomenobacter sp. TaxID=2717303 RepID=UPI0035946FB1